MFMVELQWVAMELTLAMQMQSNGNSNSNRAKPKAKATQLPIKCQIMPTTQWKMETAKHKNRAKEKNQQQVTIAT